MEERIVIVLLSSVFLGTFITRNLIVKFKTEQKIRSSDALVAASIVSTSLCIFTAIFSTFSDTVYRHLGMIASLRSPVVATLGFFLFAASIILGWIVSAQLKDSWRVGVHRDQKTELIQNGIYQYVRNPYFLTYFIMFFSLFLIRPSLLMALWVAISISVFHRMVLKEEAHLLMSHGPKYGQYKKKTGRYLPKFIKEES